MDAPELIRHKMGTRLIIGEPDGKRRKALRRAASARLAALHTALTAAGFESEASADIQRDVWFKLWGNMTMNPSRRSPAPPPI